MPGGDRCDYVQSVVDCYTTSRLDYLSLSYCSMSKLVILSYIVLILWLAFLFINLVSLREKNADASALALICLDVIPPVVKAVLCMCCIAEFHSAWLVWRFTDEYLFMLSGACGGHAGRAEYQHMCKDTWPERHTRRCVTLRCGDAMRDDVVFY